MAYHAKTQLGVLIFLAIIFLITMTIKEDGFERETLYLQIAVLIIYVALALIKFKFTINDDYLTYQIDIFSIPIYQKKIERNQINQIEFIRVGWAKKGAIIKLKRGFNIRIVRFEPTNVYINLMDFANKNSINIAKTKDYIILEKLK